jgi:uncharacterized protein (TIGR04255 family)
LPLTLPEPITDRLANSPLKLVVCQVRFEETLSVAESRTGLAIFESLGGDSGPYPQFSEFRGQQVDITVAPGSSISAQQTQLAGWKFLSEDRAWNVVVLPNSVSLETTAYTTWTADFEARLRAILGAVVTHVNPAIQLRLGLRYIDVIARPGIESPKDWRGWICESLLGPIMHPQFGSAVLSAQQQLEIDAEDGIKCTLRHGTVLDATSASPAYLLDWDVHTDAAKAFDVPEAITTLSGFNRLALRLFQVAITPEMLDELRRT